MQITKKEKKKNRKQFEEEKISHPNMINVLGIISDEFSVKL